MRKTVISIIIFTAIFLSNRLEYSMDNQQDNPFQNFTNQDWDNAFKDIVQNFNQENQVSVQPQATQTQTQVPIQILTPNVQIQTPQVIINQIPISQYLPDYISPDKVYYPNYFIKCHKCFQNNNPFLIYSTEKDFTEHIQKCHIKQDKNHDWICSLCNKDFYSTSNLPQAIQLHLQLHLNLFISQKNNDHFRYVHEQELPKQNEEFAKKSSISQIISQSHLDPKQYSVIYCKKCNQKFDGFLDESGNSILEHIYQNHINWHHDNYFYDASTITPIRYWKCNLCNKISRYEYDNFQMTNPDSKSSKHILEHFIDFLQNKKEEYFIAFASQ